MDSESVLQLLEKNGFHGVIVPYSHVNESRVEIRELLGRGLLDEEFYNENLPKYIDDGAPKAMKSPRSVFIISSPAYPHRITFELDGRGHEFTVPPTYGTGPRTNKALRGVLKEAQADNPFKIVNAYPPLKLMAVRSGLAMYGRNNITYVPGFGSYHRLTAYYTDLEVQADAWGEKKALPKCSKCRSCITACPTAAIPEDRFLLRAERCIACMNERSKEHPFPSWVKPEWHNSIVGCMICQRACPYNRDQKSRIEDGVRFSETETKQLLRDRLSGNKAPALRSKLKQAGLDDSIFPRNLKALLERADV